MEIKPVVTNICIYPVKSLDGISLQKAQIGNGGCLLHDREYAILDANGKFINGKSNALVHVLRSMVDLENKIISFRREVETVWNDFHLQKERSAINDYLSEFFNEPANLSQNTEGRFMDIPDIAGVTILSTESLETVAGWYNGMDMEETRKRFRATIEISGVPPFWEDKLFLEEGTAIEFKIGDATFLGISPRARCIVPTRHPQTGEVIHGFQRSFAQHRLTSLPYWSTLEDYAHSYYLTVNCFIPPSELGKWISVGDEVKITGKKTFPTFTR
jgi:uncharacterized protein YcbX